MFAAAAAAARRQSLKSLGLSAAYPGRFPSSSAYAYQRSVSLLLAALLAAAFALHESRAAYPLIPLRVLAQSSVWVPAVLVGSELGNMLMQTFVRVREQVFSNLIGLHLVAGSPAAEHATALLSGPYVNRAMGAGNRRSRVSAGSPDWREAYVLADMDAFWRIAWVALVGILLVLLLRRPPPNLLTPPRIEPPHSALRRDSAFPGAESGVAGRVARMYLSYFRYRQSQRIMEIDGDHKEPFPGS